MARDDSFWPVRWSDRVELQRKEEMKHDQMSEGGLAFTSQQVMEAVRVGIDPMTCFRSAVTTGEERRLKEARAERSSIVEAGKQLLAVTKVAWGNRMGLVELIKRQKIQDHLPHVAKPALFAETQPAITRSSADEACLHS